MIVKCCLSSASRMLRSYAWCDQEGRRRTVTQAEAGEQGDPLMPLLFPIGMQSALGRGGLFIETRGDLSSRCF